MLKLLIIDDNPNFCQALSGIAADTGMETTCAHTAADGLLKAAKGGFDAVIIAWMHCLRSNPLIHDQRS